MPQYQTALSSECNKPTVSPHQSPLSSECNKPTDDRSHHTNHHYPASATNQQTNSITTPISIIQQVQQTNRPPFSPHQSPLSSECNKPTDQQYHHTNQHYPASATNQQTTGLTTPISIIQRVLYLYFIKLYKIYIYINIYIIYKIIK